ncbi:anti-anti-sigma factor [Asanoa ferruginea]|uniref:Anti-anti-sigma factor n=1 Tax=Asanoa ferruginea TaxID=53367 RepID=A0A3D9ZUK9_9ACTN|nr:STAS domain-containing protein [Asanoa ferruginea]REG00886.1 anti-anti-sigma factor [Asanoa ferruginea]GIF47463.1 hypothetical protein Afe04nite_20020 [Asanoa ferruginea]
MSPEPLARIEVGEHHGLPLLRVLGEVDMTNAATIGEQLRANTGDASTLTVDLTDLEFMDSQGLHMLHLLAVDLAGNDTALVVIAPVPGIAGNLLTLVGMNKTLDIRPNLSD